MDRSGVKRVLIGIAATLVIGAGAERLPLRAARWTAAQALPQALYWHAPECLTLPRTTAAAQAVRVGRVAFRTPVLLGGQAARAGLSCESCHRAGRNNPDFLFPGLSGAPGTADVTASLMSSHRGDGVFNPKTIPDLAGLSTALRKVPDKDPAALRTFIHGLIVEEFDGPEPPEAVLDGLVAYVRALSPKGCRGNALVPVSLTGLLADAQMGLTAAYAALSAGDYDTARLMIAGARAQLGLIHERYQRPGLEQARERTVAFDQELGSIQSAISRDRSTAAGRLAASRADLSRLAKQLETQVGWSDFIPH